MSTLQQFALYNLSLALVGGTLAWAVVGTGVYLLGVRHGKLRFCVFAAPLLKSTLLLLGIGLVLPWPREVFAAWHEQALGPSQVLPFFLLFTGSVIVVQSLLTSRSRRGALAAATPAETASPRLTGALDRVMLQLEERREILLERCGCEPGVKRPRLLVSTEDIHSPLIATDEPATIVFPEALIDRLGDAELHGALAHEVAHLQLRTPISCFSASWVQSLAVANPMATIMAAQLLGEEEKACDDLAVAATGDAESYAGMLLKAYRFAHPRRGTVVNTLHYLPSLLGFKPMLTERVERLVHDAPPGADMGRQYAAFAVLWAALVVLFFNT